MATQAEVSQKSAELPVQDAAPIRIGLRCPHCEAKARARTSELISPLYREIYFQCTDVLCGHTWVAALSVLHTISPSAKPDPAINIPESPRIRH